MESRKLQQDDMKLVTGLWSKRMELVNLGFNVRQQYLDTEARVYGKIGELEEELNTLVKVLRDREELSDGWKLDPVRGVFVNPASEA